ncbi:hypothetical protein [Nodosilinea sp. P-1105]|uniref:hypothetical protein n=1 Tax=Nodosilinea sp. P-1105 TaxID=2546229 RepID=UPI00146F1B8E|nr:hypothetical protein [Nodosilinea sp. P-1105]NMF83432.1 hypothetical protein [Nodosilinea sp. P-1105]
MTYSATPQAEQPRNANNRKLYLVIAGIVVAASLGGATFKLMQSDSETTTGADPAVFGEPTDIDAAAPVFESEPFFQAASPSIQLADPSLLQSTSSQARVETVTAGRPDPFSPVIVPTRAPSRPQPVVAAATPATPTAQAPTATAQPPSPTVSPVTPVTTQALPPLPQGALPILPPSLVPGSVPQDSQTVAVAPTGSPTFQSLIDQVVISGAVQVGSSVSVIVTEPGSTVSRRVSQGDMLAGGRIRVKAIDMSAQEPMIVLTYDGRDYTRSIGASMVSTL